MVSYAKLAARYDRLVASLTSLYYTTESVPGADENWKALVNALCDAICDVRCELRLMEAAAPLRVVMRDE